MVCIYCGNKTKVANSRANRKTHTTWRRRQCLDCHTIFTTREHIDLAETLMVQSPVTRAPVPMHRDTLLASVVKCLDHHGDDAILEASALCDTVLQLLLGTKPLQPVVSTVTISELTYGVLQRYDTIAAIKYRSYREKLFTNKRS